MAGGICGLGSWNIGSRSRDCRPGECFAFGLPLVLLGRDHDGLALVCPFVERLAGGGQFGDPGG
jgi:hypothetical protein